VDTVNAQGSAKTNTTGRLLFRAIATCAEFLRCRQLDLADDEFGIADWRAEGVGEAWEARMTRSPCLTSDVVNVGRLTPPSHFTSTSRC